MPRYLRSLLIAALAVFCFLAARAQSTSAPYDLIIRNGHIIDGTGSPWYSGDIGIRNGRIAAIGFLGAAQAKRTIDAHGMVVAPGFIDMLGQSEMTILVTRIFPQRSFRASPPSSPEKAARPRRSTTPSSRPTSSLTTT